MKRRGEQQGRKVPSPLRFQWPGHEMSSDECLNRLIAGRAQHGSIQGASIQAGPPVLNVVWVLGLPRANRCFKGGMGERPCPRSSCFPGFWTGTPIVCLHTYYHDGGLVAHMSWAEASRFKHVLYRISAGESRV